MIPKQIIEYCKYLYGDKIPLSKNIDKRVPSKDAWQRTEHELQRAFFQWLAEVGAKHNDPHVRNMLWTAHAIPNGGNRNVAEAGRLVAEGVKGGIPDVCIPIPRKGYCGLYIEFKKAGGSPSEEQRIFLNTLASMGFRCYVFNCLKTAKAFTVQYIEPLITDIRV